MHTSRSTYQKALILRLKQSCRIHRKQNIHGVLTGLETLDSQKALAPRHFQSLEPWTPWSLGGGRNNPTLCQMQSLDQAIRCMTS